MPDSERELRMRHTSEGAEKVRADLDKIKDGEEHVEQTTEDLGKATDDLGVSKENLTSVLNNIHPALGGLADGLINATQLAGKLGTANLDLSRIIQAGREAIVKYKDAIMLLGAGGAAVLALLALKQAWEGVAQAERDAIEAAQAFAETQARIAGEGEALRQEVGRALIAQTGGQVTDETITETVAEVRRLMRESNVERARAIKIALGEEPPPTKDELEALQRLAGGDYTARMREIRFQAMQATRTGAIMPGVPTGMYTGDISELRKYVEENAGADVDEVLAEMAKRMLEWQGTTPRTLSREGYGKGPVVSEAERMLKELGFTQETVTPTSPSLGVQMQDYERDRPSLGVPMQDYERDRPSPSAAEQRETSEALKQAAMLQRESAQALDEVTRRLASTVEHLDSATERANQNRLRHGTTPRREAIAMREG